MNIDYMKQKIFCGGLKWNKFKYMATHKKGMKVRTLVDESVTSASYCHGRG